MRRCAPVQSSSSQDGDFRYRTRRPFDTTDQLDDRIRRADSAFAMAYELGTKVVLVRAGEQVHSERTSLARRERSSTALARPGHASRAPGRIRPWQLETGSEPARPLQVVPATSIGFAWRSPPASTRRPDCRPAWTRSHWCVSWRRGSFMLMPTTRPVRPIRLPPTRAGSDFLLVPSIGKNTWALLRRDRLSRLLDSLARGRTASRCRVVVRSFRLRLEQLRMNRIVASAQGSVR